MVTPATSKVSDLGAQGEPVVCGPRSDAQIVAEVNALAAFMLTIQGTGYQAPEGFKFYEAPSDNIRARRAWLHAVEAYEMITQAEVHDALLAVEDDAPAAPRTGSGVSVEEIAAVLWNNRHTRYSGIKFETAKSFGATYSQSDFKASVAAVYEDARAILALFAQAPRDGGETQGGWQPIETAPKDGRDILGYCPTSGEQFVACFVNGDWQFAYFGPADCPIVCDELSFWRPLPTPPSGVETGGSDA